MKRNERFRSPLGRIALAAAGLLALAGIGGAVLVRQLTGSDHQDTPEVEFSPRMDINDVYAFPGGNDDRIVLVMDTSSPLTPAQSASAVFDPELLYQIKVDNTGDAVEDLADPRLLSAMARLEAARGDRETALAYARQAAGITPDIATVALIGDASEALGDSAGAEAAYREVEKMAAENPEPYNRAWTLFRIDHGRALPETVALLREELESRRDVYGYDQLAWALYRSGDYAGARVAMAGALRMGTQDAILFFHAGMIETALGAREAARGHLEHALALNPTFHPAWPAVAAAALDSLRGS